MTRIRCTSRNQLFRNLGHGTAPRDHREAGAVFQLSEVSRGAAFGDVDNDGDVDILVTNNNGPARLLINQVGNRNHWIGLRLIDGESGRDMLGTRVAVHRPERAHALENGSNGCQLLFRQRSACAGRPRRLSRN